MSLAQIDESARSGAKAPTPVFEARAPASTAACTTCRTAACAGRATRQAAFAETVATAFGARWHMLQTVQTTHFGQRHAILAVGLVAADKHRQGEGRSRLRK